MALPPGIGRVTFSYDSRGASGVRQNRLHWNAPQVLDGPAPGTTPWFNSQSELWRQFWVAVMQVHHASSTDLVGVDISYDEETRSFFPTSVSGTRGDSLMPPQMGVNQRLVVDGAARRRWGRLFLVDAFEIDFDAAGIMSPAAATAYLAMNDDYVTFLGSLPFAGSGGDVTTSGVVVLSGTNAVNGNVTEIQPSPIPAWLRRRGR